MDVHALGFQHAAVMIACAAGAVTDLRSGRIYNVITLPAMAAGLAWALLRGGEGAVAASVTGLALGLIPFGLAAWRGWIGGGDVKLFGAIGALAGPFFLFDCLFVAFLLAAAYALVLVVRGARGIGPRALAGAVWRRLTSPRTPAGDGGLLERPVRMGVFILAGAVVAALRVAATATG